MTRGTRRGGNVRELRQQLASRDIQERDVQGIRQTFDRVPIQQHTRTESLAQAVPKNIAQLADLLARTQVHRQGGCGAEGCTQNGALGSGSLLKDNTILTNRHVVGGEREVTVVFKPSDPSGRAENDEVVQADVIKLDGQRDLALLRPASIPSRRPLDISAEDSIDVGTDVAAIGHPSAKTWTFTKGIVSAFRPAFEWSGGPNDSKHVATVIQTQTPINPGNSGGPLLTEDGKVVGVNSFGTTGAESLNFAIEIGRAHV